MLTKICEQCGKEFSKLPKKSYAGFERQRFCSRRCRGLYENPRKPDIATPYRRVSCGYIGTFRDEHRDIIERTIGRRLERNEYVHHINGDTKDNRLENLQIVSALEHNRIHLQKYPISKTCVICAATFIPHKTKRKRQQTCSRDCMKALISLKQIKPDAEYSRYKEGTYPSYMAKQNQVAAEIIKAIKEV